MSDMTENDKNKNFETLVERTDSLIIIVCDQNGCITWVVSHGEGPWCGRRVRCSTRATTESEWELWWNRNLALGLAQEKVGYRTSTAADAC